MKSRPRLSADAQYRHDRVWRQYFCWFPRRVLCGPDDGGWRWVWLETIMTRLDAGTSLMGRWDRRTNEYYWQKLIEQRKNEENGDKDEPSSEH